MGQVLFICTVYEVYSSCFNYRETRTYVLSIFIESQGSMPGV